jgi:hypothetical protein
MNNEFRASDILNQLDEYFELDFPSFLNANYPSAAMRLTVFRDPTEWLITFEELVYGTKEHSFLNIISAFGNKIPEPGYQGVIRLFTETNSPVWHENQNSIGDKWHFEFIVKGVRRSFSVTPEDYRQAKLDPENDSQPELRLLRLLVSLIPDELFLSDEKLLKACNRANIPKFIELREWRHPDVYEGELPSHTVCFRSLARAIAENDKTLYNCPEPINSAWYYWEEE